MHHNNFLDCCLRESMITSSYSFQQIHKILGICLVFSTFIQGITKNIQEKEESTKIDFKMGARVLSEKRRQILDVMFFSLKNMYILFSNLK
jgi:hypothetical protein